MLDRLPVELLLPILRHATPLDFTPAIYSDRWTLLPACCLVSKRLCRVAQPMLSELVRLQSETDVDALLASGKAAEGVRLLVLDGESGDSDLASARGKLRELLRACSRTSDLRILGLQQVELDDVALLTELRSFTVTAHSFPSESSVPHFTELSLTDTTISADSLIHQHRNSPHLRALALAFLPDFDLAAFLPSASELFRRPKVFNVDICDESVWPLHLCAPGEAKLVDCQLHTDYIRTIADLDVLPSALRLYLAGDDDEAEADDGEPFEGVIDAVQLFIDRILKPVRSSHFFLSVLILPSQLHLTKCRSTEAQQTAERFEQACKRCGVELVWEKEADWRYRSLISPEFWRRARRMKQERSVGGQE